jgi:hypothetical protein
MRVAIECVNWIPSGDPGWVGLCKPDGLGGERRRVSVTKERWSR